MIVPSALLLGVLASGFFQVTWSRAPKCDPNLVKVGDLTKQQKYECLIEDLFQPENYSPLVRPVANISKCLTVKFSVQLSQIINLDEKNQVMKTNVWLQMYWVDYQLVWINDPIYKDVGVFRVSPDQVWIPDVVLFNNADGNYEVSYRSNVVVYSSGDINWIPPSIYKSSCSIDVQYFPFDEQICEMKFGSWTFSESQLKFTFYKGVRHLDVTDYLENGAWDIVGGNGDITSVSSSGVDGKKKAMVTFKLVLRRKTLFYTVNLIIPCVLISFVTLSVFILPADAGEKITLCISILLALVVFLLLISKILPPSLTIPLVSQYLLFTFIMNILAILSTVVVINRNYRTPRTHHMPYWVRLVFLNHMPRYLLMKRPDHDNRWQEQEKAPPPEVANILRHIRDPDLTHSTNVDLVPVTSSGEGPGDRFIEHRHPNCRLGNTTSLGREAPSSTSTTLQETSFSEPPMIHVSQELYRAAESLKFIHTHLKKDDDYQTIIDDWRYVARVIDRLLLLIFLIVTIAGTCGLFMKAPHIFESADPHVLEEMKKNFTEADPNADVGGAC